MEHIKNFFTQLFDGINGLGATDSWVVLLMLLIAYLIGLISAWLWRGSKIRALRKELEERNAELNSLRAKYDELKEALELKEADLKKARLEIEELKARIRQLEEEKGQLHGNLYASQQMVKQLEDEKTALNDKEKGYLSQLEAFDNQVLGLKTKNQALSATVDQNANALKEMAELQSQLGVSKGRINLLEKANADLNGKLEDLTAKNQAYGAAQADYDDLRTNYEKTSTEHADLTTQLAALTAANLAFSNKQSDYDDIKAQLEAMGKDNADLRAQLDEASLSNQAYASAQADCDELKAKLEELDISNANLQTKLSEIAAQNQAYGAAQLDYDDLLDDLKEIKEDNLELRAQMDALVVDNEALKLDSTQFMDYDDLQAQLKELEGDGQELRLQVDDLITQNEAYKAAQAEYDAMNAKLDALNVENDNLRQQLAFANTELEETKTARAAAPVEETKEEKAARARTALAGLIGGAIPLATADDKDDLKEINGVGPFIEKKLNGLGIYTFEQVSKFDDATCNLVTDAIQFFPGRIQRDDWVGQAARLHAKKGQAYSQPIAFGNKMYKPDDLKIVEGIGPKIEGLLNNGGIDTWAGLAAAKVERLREILAAAGDRYRMHQPDTWPQQAQLAKDGKWEELQELQDYLDGGKIPTKK